MYHFSPARSGLVKSRKTTVTSPRIAHIKRVQGRFVVVCKHSRIYNADPANGIELLRMYNHLARS